MSDRTLNPNYEASTFGVDVFSLHLYYIQYTFKVQEGFGNFLATSVAKTFEHHAVRLILGTAEDFLQKNRIEQQVFEKATI